MEEGLIAKLALGALVPGTVGLGVLGAAWWRQRGSSSEIVETAGAMPAIERGGEPFWIIPALVAGVSAVMIPILTEARAFPPAASDEWLPLVAVAAGALELATRGSRFPASLRWVLRAVLLVLIGMACARNMLAHRWSITKGVVCIGGFSTLTLAGTAALEGVLARIRGVSAPFLLLIIVGGVSQVLAIGYSGLKLGQAVGVVAAILGAACVVAWFRRRFALAFGGVFVPVAITGSGVFAGNIAASTRIADYTMIASLCIALAAMLPGLICLRPFSHLRGWRRTAFVFFLAAVPMGVALGVAAANELKRVNDENDSAMSMRAFPGG